ncbi:hypothetical protein BH23VER1_BH23VER1_31860 [soil metagenome]
MINPCFSALAFALTLTLGFPLGAGAVTTAVDVAGDGPLGKVEGTVSYTPFSPTAGKLSFALTNTSPVGNGGFMTALVFDLPNSVSYDSFRFSSISSTPAFSPILDNGNGNSPTKAEPYGAFKVGASSTGDFLGGGRPNSGLPVGETGWFDFALTGSGLNTLTIADFVEAGSVFGEDGVFFVTRFMGFEDGGSNKTEVGVTFFHHVPDSGTSLALLAPCVLGLLAACSRGRRRSRRTA